MGGASKPRSLGAPRWAVLTIAAVVNAVCVLQTIGFLTRPAAPWVNRAAGVVMALLAVPATVALVGFLRERSGWRFVVGPLVYDAFIVLMVVVDYWLGIEFRAPRRPDVLVPYVVLFFLGIVLMGAPLVRVDRRLWLVTAASATALVGAMIWAQAMGVG